MVEEIKSGDLPTKPSEKLIRWAEDKCLSHTHILLYRAGWYEDPLTEMKEECVDTLCSYCGKRAKLNMIRYRGCSCGYSYSSAPFGFENINGESVTSSQCTLCPCCGVGVTARYLSSVNDNFVIAGAGVLEITAIKGALVLIYWHISRHISDTARIFTVTMPHYAYAVDKKKISCFTAYGNNSWSSAPYKDHAGRLQHVYPWDRKTLEGTTAENSKLDLYLKCKGDLFPVSYLRLWVQRPHVENLLVQGAGNILAEMIKRDCKSGAWSTDVVIPRLKDVCWRDKRPAQMLSLTKDEFRCAVQQKWNLEELETYRELRDREKIDPWTDILLVRKCGLENVTHLLRTQKTGSIMQSVRYLTKQQKRDAITLTDYWRLAVLNGENITLPKVRFPQNLKRAHDHESDRQKFDKKRGYPERFAKRLEYLSAFCFEKDGLLIRPVASAEELYQEGKILQHCVYSYLESHALGKTAILPS